MRLATIYLVRCVVRCVVMCVVTIWARSARAEAPKPLVALVEYDAGYTEEPKYGPRDDLDHRRALFVLYDDGRAIFSTHAHDKELGSPYETVVLDANERAALLAQLPDDVAWKKVSPPVKADEEHAAKLVRRICIFRSARSCVDVNGETTRAPSAFLQLFDKLAAFRHSGAVTWLPERVPLVLVGPSQQDKYTRPWPKSWDAPCTPQHAHGIDFCSTLVPGADLRVVQALDHVASETRTGHEATVRCNGVVYELRHDIPLPSEAAWLPPIKSHVSELQRRATLPCKPSQTTHAASSIPLVVVYQDDTVGFSRRTPFVLYADGRVIYDVNKEPLEPGSGYATVVLDASEKAAFVASLPPDAAWRKLKRYIYATSGESDPGGETICLFQGKAKHCVDLIGGDRKQVPPIFLALSDQLGHYKHPHAVAWVPERISIQLYETKYGRPPSPWPAQWTERLVPRASHKGDQFVYADTTVPGTDLCLVQRFDSSIEEDADDRTRLLRDGKVYALDYWLPLPGQALW